jgi:hypothetical protein
VFCVYCVYVCMHAGWRSDEDGRRRVLCH